MRNKAQTVNGYTITVLNDGTSVRVITPNGGSVHCLRRGTHVTLSVLPKYIRAEVSKMTGWVIT